MFQLGSSVEQTNLNPPAVDQVTTSLGNFYQNLLMNPLGNSPFAGLPNYAQQAYTNVGGSLNPLLQGAGLGAANQVIQSALPTFERQNASGLGQLGSAAPSATGSAFGLQGIDFLTNRNQAFDQFVASALQQGQQTALQAGGLIGQLAQGAQSAQQNQVINPILQLLLGGSQFAQPRTAATVQPGILDYATQLGPLALIPSFYGGDGGGSTG